MADKEDDILQEARERFQEATDAWSETQAQALDDMKFALLGDQWPQDIMQRRRTAGRPCMTINRMPSFIRQVVNDGRQNRPAIKVRPMDSAADVATSEVESGLIRHIESISKADVAYDTALQHQTAGGFGFVSVDVDYACDDSFEKEIFINSIPNQLSVLWDANTQTYDNSDWDYAFLSSSMAEDKFKKMYPGKKFEASGFASDAHLIPWFEGKQVRICKYYSRTDKPRKIVLLSDGSVVAEDVYVKNKDIFDQAGIAVTRERVAKSYEVSIRKITGVEILEEQTWAIDRIPVVPFYGDSFNIEGRWYHQSLIHDAKDSQRIFNFSRSTATELISLSPKVPFIGPKGSFKTDADKWANVNTENYPFIEYDGQIPPQRQPFAGPATGAIEEAMMASEDMKAIVGMGNPSLGMPDGRVISGKAKRMERHEADTSTFHFTDNQHRGIRGVGEVLTRLIPLVYTGQRVIRILGVDGKPGHVPLGQQVQLPNGTSRIYDLGVGKYDVSIEAGPSYTTRREEAVDALSTIVSAAPQTAPILAPQLVKMFDMPDSEKITAMLATTMPPAARAVFDGTPPPPPSPPPEVQQAMAKAQADMAINQQKAAQEFQLEKQKAENRAEIERTQAQADIAVMQMKAQAEIELERQRAAVQLELKRQEAALSRELSIHQASQAAQQNAAPGV
jgi:hypothetical protein